jgi:flagellar basal body-associated protein FliL
MPKNLIRILIIVAGIIVVLALAYAVFYFITADPRVSQNVLKSSFSLFA